MSDRATPASTAELTAEIVSAYVSNNEIALSDVAALITAVAGQLSRIGTEPGRAEIGEARAGGAYSPLHSAGSPALPGLR